MGFSSLLLDWLPPSQILTQKKNMVQLTGSEFQTTIHTSKKKSTVQLTDLEFQTAIHTSKKKNTVQPTDSEFQTTTTKKDTARDTTTQDATEEEPTEEEELASEEDAEVVTEEEVTPRDAESSTVNKVEHQERSTFENVFICVCSLLAVNKITKLNKKKKTNWPLTEMTPICVTSLRHIT